MAPINEITVQDLPEAVVRYILELRLKVRHLRRSLQVVQRSQRADILRNIDVMRVEPVMLRQVLEQTTRSYRESDDDMFEAPGQQPFPAVPSSTLN